MNEIYQRSRIKRKYHKTPPCGHTDGYCDMEHCRQKYAIKVPLIKQKIGNLNFKTPPFDRITLKRDRAIQKIIREDIQRMDAEQEFIQQGQTDKDFNVVKYAESALFGEWFLRKQQIKRYKRMFWRVIFILIGIVVAYPLVIFIGDLFY